MFCSLVPIYNTVGLLLFLISMCLSQHPVLYILFSIFWVNLISNLIGAIQWVMHILFRKINDIGGPSNCTHGLMIWTLKPGRQTQQMTYWSCSDIGGVTCHIQLQHHRTHFLIVIFHCVNDNGGPSNCTHGLMVWTLNPDDRPNKWPTNDSLTLAVWCVIFGYKPSDSLSNCHFSLCVLTGFVTVGPSKSL